MAARWIKERGYLDVPPKVEKFLSAYSRLCERHGLCLTFDTDTRSFVVTPFDEEELRWVADAMVDPRVAAGLIED